MSSRQTLIAIYLNLGSLVTRVFGDTGTCRELYLFWISSVRIRLNHSLRAVLQDELSDYLNCLWRNPCDEDESVSEREGYLDCQEEIHPQCLGQRGCSIWWAQAQDDGHWGCQVLHTCTMPWHTLKSASTLSWRAQKMNSLSSLKRRECEFSSLPPEDIAFPRTANNIQVHHPTHLCKGTPLHIRGCVDVQSPTQRKADKQIQPHPWWWED